MDLLVYTAIFGNFDTLKSPKVQNRKIKYICFTDRDFNCPPWEIIKVKPIYKDPRRENRRYKLLSHKFCGNYKYSIYLDANLEIICDLSKIAKKWLGKHDIAVKRHPELNCLYKEARICLERKLDDRKLILKQINKYYKDGHPKNSGLTNDNFIIRRHTDKIKKFNELWWKQVKKFSRRDQLSLPYLVNKLNIEYSIIPLDEYNNCIIGKPHKKFNKYYYANFNERILNSLTKFLFLLSHPRFFFKKNGFRTLKNYLFNYNYKSLMLLLPKFIKFFLTYVY